MTTPTDSAEKVVADHERIWLQNAADGEASGEGRLWCQDKVWPEDEAAGEPTEYVRADIHAAALALIESQRATIERVERERDEALQLSRHLRVAQIIYDDGPDESDKAQADLHMSAAILLAKRLVPWGDTRVSDAEAHAVINAAPRVHLTGGRDV